MTDDAEGFLARWSRRKRAAEREEPAPAASPPAVSPVAAPVDETDGEEAFDPASLPAIDTLGADSDYTVFLRKGVPKALQTAALRRAWVTDPAITGYKTLAEYDWDCNAPGYAALRPTDCAKRMTDALFRHLREAEEAQEPPVAQAGAVAQAGNEPPEAEEAPDQIARPS